MNKKPKIILTNHFHTIKLGINSLLIILILFTEACVEPYEADIKGETELISIEGSIIKGDPVQHIAISTTTSILEKEFKPVRGCEVKVVDELNNEFMFAENSIGTYSLAIDDDLLIYNRKYKLAITTPHGVKYESNWESINNSTAIDTVYYELEAKFETFTGEKINGIQFYIDIDAPDTGSRYFRWNITESYEYTSSGKISYLFLNRDLIPSPVSDVWSVYRCWISEEVEGIYISNTMNLTINEKKEIPLNYVSSLTDRLKIKYSLLVSQYPLSEGAFKYWQNNQIATETSDGLYTQQPGQAISNIQCINKDENVLGYFWASSVTKKRIFVPRIKTLAVQDFPCDTFAFADYAHGKGPFPVYISIDERTGIPLTGRPICFDCTLRGGSTTKPDFWQ